MSASVPYTEDPHYDGIVAPFDSSLFHIGPLDGRGNGLIADKFIPSGTLLFREFPMVENRSERKRPTDDCCLWCANRIPGCNVTEHSCSGCKLNFCSSECQKLADGDGHQWLCSLYGAGGLIEQLSANDRTGNVVLALKLYAKVAQKVLESQQSPVGSSSSNSLPAPPACVYPDEMLDTVMGCIQQEDYCKTVHAFRTGQFGEDVDDEMFNSLIGPAYFRSNLEGPLEAFRAHFSSPSVVALWGDDASAERFLQSKLFNTDATIRHITGAFMTNCLETSKRQDHKDDAKGPVSIFSTSNAMAETDIKATVAGKGLYRIYSMLNHACDCNTWNGSSPDPALSSSVVLVYAGRDIQPNEEITTSYLHATDASQWSRRKRHKALKQYMFACKCPMCEAEYLSLPEGERDLSDSDGDSDSDSDEE